MINEQLDISANRSQKNWTRIELLKRIFWKILSPLFRYSPRLAWGWRNSLLRLFGAKIGKNVRIYPNVKVTIPWNISIDDYTAIGNGAILYALGPISIGKNTTISQYAHICAGSHAFNKPTMDLLKPPITIGDNVWICADAFIGPNVKIDGLTIIGARAVVTKDISDSQIVAGNPAIIIGQRKLP